MLALEWRNKQIRVCFLDACGLFCAKRAQLGTQAQQSAMLEFLT